MKTKIKTIPIKWQNSDGKMSTLNCPVCGKVWEKEGEGEVTSCEHLKFRHIAGIDTEYFGDWDHSGFDVDEVIDGGSTDDIDVIYLFEEMGMSCGPVFISIWYGVKK